ncbi:amidoligase family protein [Celerinatantimonas yamalensis]|uniref:Amidoligase family protein n=1 Tax=Celerinatantimonas yamalensis TaxID=559956 RepID=A0ABW9G3R9_9GAMM
MNQLFSRPEQPNKADNKPRKIGFELEFSGIDLKTTGQVITDALAGELKIISEAECKVETTLGTFKVEVDWQFAKTTARQRINQRAQELGEARADDPFMQWITKLATVVVPVEVVCPPLVIADLERLHPMVKALQQHGALGTNESVIYAFGVHINPELPSYDSQTIIAYLQSFILAQDWLIKRHHVDMVRRVTPYINVYPEPYCDRVLHYSGDESLTQIIDDYLHWNATRNRALDMLPLFMHLDKARIQDRLDDSLINARPTLHYRLPNCEIEKADWGLYKSWNVWCVLEYIANHTELRQQLISDWCTNDQLANCYSEKIWQQLDQIEQNLSLA